MTLEEFRQVTRVRIPTPTEFVAFAEGQGWKLTVKENGTGSIQTPSSDTPFAKLLARLIAREPYRTGVLKELHRRWQQGEPSLSGQPREWLWRGGHRFAEANIGCQAENWHPVGAWWWRYVGETTWRVVPGREQVACVGQALLDGAGLPAGERLRRSA